jgi:phospholipid/cholesterol/gamma-HCH transport system substrate-binding protein
VLAAAMILLVGGQGGFFWERYRLKTRFPDVRGLKEGAVVRVAGVEKGKVTAVEFVGAEVDVLLELNKEMQPRITTESRASLGSLSLLGEPVIDVSPSVQGQPLPEDAYIPASTSGGHLSDVAASANRGLEQVTLLLEDVRKGKGTIGKLIVDDAVYSELQGFLDAANGVVDNLNRGQGTLGSLMKDPSAYRSLDASLRNLSTITERMNAGEGTLGKFLSDDAFARSLTTAADNFGSVAQRLNKGEGTAGKLVTDTQLYDRLNTVAARLDQLTTELNKGQGSMGRLLRDNQLYDNINSAANELRQLVGDIRKDPKRYLNIRVSIF